MTIENGVTYDIENFPELNIHYSIKQINPEGNVVYEYNPLRNFRFQEDQFKLDENGEKVLNDDGEPIILIPKNQITDLDTENFNFDLEHPVDIQCQPSYDGSVNLILNDYKNPPRLINSRFTVLQNNKYKVVDRFGSNDTNLYDESQFDLDTSLYKRVIEIPKIHFNGLTNGGNLPVGNYNFYFKYSDADGNETDFIGESGTVICHIGNIKDPKSIRGGMQNENSNKTVLFTLTNVDSAYDYITVYYTRNTSGAQQDYVTEAKKINRNFKVKGNSCLITIDGYERTTDVSIDDINVKYFVANSAKTQAICQNRLFLGNLGKETLDHEDFQDLSLRMLPYYSNKPSRDLVGELNHNYEEVGNTLKEDGYEYYNVNNIYNHLGYWNEEIYRLGVVYILNDDSLSPVYNIRGIDSLPNESEAKLENGKYTQQAMFNGDERVYISYDEITYAIDESASTNLENAKGVIRIKDSTSTDLQVYSINVHVPKNVIQYLKESKKIKGFFFVRQKRIPTILAQAFVMGHDSLSGLPLINYGEKYIAESFIDTNAKLDAAYENRLFAIDNALASNEIAICPEYELRQEYFNNFFTDTQFTVKEPIQQLTGNLTRDITEARHYYETQYSNTVGNQKWDLVDIIGVSDSIAAKRNEINLYSSVAGNAESVSDFKFVGKEFTIDYSKKKKISTLLTGEEFKGFDNNIVRGAFGPYIGITGYRGKANHLINIYIPNYSESNMSQYFKIRYEDASSYFAISDRIALKDIDNEEYSQECFRGDCYICNFTHRLNRNFQDISAPNADTIVDENCWVNNYKPDKAPEELNKINIGDLNAVRLGSWVTFKLCSNINLSMRDADYSYTEEELLTGNPRTFYPLSEISTDGNYKIPEASIINTGVSNTLSSRYNFTQDNIPYIKNVFQTRIAFSDVSITDAFRNGFRTFQASHYQDYPTTYGGLIKLIEVGDDLLAVFEHAVAKIPVKERTLTGQGDGGNVYINSQKVLPDTMLLLSDSIGSQWSESVLKTPYGIYGIDTIAKKIWRTNAVQDTIGSLQIISDFTVQEFLNQNITLSERENTPIIGIRNVKTHYNAFKNDVMFTYYDNLYGFEEKSWNLCYNELMASRSGGNGFQTFYSWIPSYSENIDNIFFSFDRNTSKYITKLGLCNSMYPNNDGITVTPSKDTNTWTLSLENRPTPDCTYQITYNLEHDIFGNRTQFTIEGNTLKFTGTDFNEKIWLLNISASITFKDSGTELEQYIAGFNNFAVIHAGYYKNQIALSSKDQINKLTTNFWKHGQSGIIDIKEKIKPCHWYGKQHPFEFEFVVNPNVDTHKIFDNLQIISNNVPPKSFHYEIVGDCYDFADDKLNMFVRQEYTKALYQNNGSDITYNKESLNMVPSQRYIEGTADKKDKSTLFPLYYYRQDTINEIEDSYIRLKNANSLWDYDYRHLAGAEIVHYPTLNEFRIQNHAEAVDITKGGRLRGNMQYLLDKWNIQINPINIVQKNETSWDKIPLVVSKLVPNDLINKRISNNDIPKELKELGYVVDNIDTTSWGNRKEALLKDKFMKVKIRYEGDKLVIIGGVRTLFRTV